MERFIPLLALIITPRTQQEVVHLTRGLLAVMSEDAMLRAQMPARFEPATVLATSERQLEHLVHRLKRDFRVEAAIGRPLVVCCAGLARS